MKVEERVVAQGFRFPEGPSYGRDGCLYVVELAGRRVSRIAPDGEVAVLADMGGSPNGSAFDADGGLYVANGGGRWAAETSTGGEPGPADGTPLLQRVSMDGSFETVLALVDGQALNAPNDLCFGPDGTLWFTDPAWPDEDGQVPPGRICHTNLEGTAVIAHEGLAFPNGLAVSEDGATLIVAESGTCLLWAFPILGPGRLGEPRQFADLGEGAIPDGMCFDVRGRLLCAAHGAGAVFVFPASGGDAENRIDLSDPDITNLCFGGEDFQTLYITQADSGRVVAVEWDTPGMRLFPDRS